MNPILILEYQSLIKENRGHWRNGSFYEHMFVQGIYSVNLNHLARLVSEKTEKKKIKDTELNRQELPIVKPGTI